MKGVNKAIIIGRIGKDPETRYSQSGSAITNIVVATDESWKDKQSGETKKKTEWHRVTLFGRQAEVAAEYCSKGGAVYIEGRIETQKWKDREGNDRYTTVIIARDLQLFGSKQNGQQQSKPKPPPQPQQQEYIPGADEGEEDFDDDIPF